MNKNLKVTMKEKMNNKGFSLVELIIVIAIMAVLIAVLAPQFIRYVERSRYQKDMTAVGELQHAMQVAASNETAVVDITTWPVTATIACATGAVTWTNAAEGDSFVDEVNAAIMGAAATPCNLGFTSTTLASGADITIVITATGITTLNNTNIAP